jgi:hypothetical protein
MTTLRKYCSQRYRSSPFPTSTTSVKGPASYYKDADGTYETIPENLGIRCFIWEHFNTLNHVVQRVKYSSGRFSGTKGTLCTAQFKVIGHVCTYEGRIPDQSRVVAIEKRGPCTTLTDIRAFLGTVGVCRIFIRNFAHRAYPITHLTRKDVPFVFGSEQRTVQEDLK